MLKDVICKLDYSTFEEIALVIFGLCFFAICWQAWRLTSEASPQSCAPWTAEEGRESGGRDRARPDMGRHRGASSREEAAERDQEARQPGACSREVTAEGA